MNNYWNQVITYDNKIYYHNPITNEISWILPENGIILNNNIIQVIKPIAPSKELRKQRLDNARKSKKYMTFW